VFEKYHHVVDFDDNIGIEIESRDGLGDAFRSSAGDTLKRNIGR
jgi:hypothetical protein